MTNRPKWAATALAIMAGLTALSTSAAAPRQFVVSWVYYAVANRDGDCPGGLNPDSEQIFRRILKERQTPADKVDGLVAAFPNSAFATDISHRGTLNGQPADVYVYPTSVPDPNLHLVQGSYGLGFNLDGKVGPNDFVDPLTGEKGVDNQFFRAVGCSSQMRAVVGKPGVYQAVQYDEVRDSQPAWLIEITGADSIENADDVQVSIMLARESAARDVNGATQADMTYHADPNVRTAGNVVHGRIRNGLLTTDKLNFYMPGEPRIQADYDFRDARLRFQFMPDGSLKGYIGGYQDWRTVYSSIALAGIALETLVSYDVPGLFYAFRKLADAYPDPKTGQNTRISTTYAIEAVPAFVVKPLQQQPTTAGNATRITQRH